MLLFNTLKNNYHFYHHSAALWHAFIITLKNNYLSLSCCSLTHFYNHHRYTLLYYNHYVVFLLFNFLASRYFFDILFDNLSFFVFYLLSKTYRYFLHVLLLILYFYSILLICLTAHLYFFYSIILLCLIIRLYFLYNNLFYSFVYLKNKNKKKLFMFL